MSAFEGLVNGWTSLAWAATWQLAALALLAWLGERLLKVRHPRPRHAIWWLVLLAPLILAPARLALERRAAVVSLHLPAPVADALPLIPSLTSAPRPVTSNIPPNVVPLDSHFPASPPASRVVDIVALVWLAGCALLVLRLIVGHVRIRRMLRASRPVDDPHVLAILRDLCTGAGLRGEVAIVNSSAVGAPILYGLRNPVVLVPEGWGSAFDAEELRSLLAHEVAHIRRGDCWANLAQRLIGIPLFFHPAAWYASSQIILAREQLCDNWALEQSGDARAYAQSLASAAERAYATVAVAPLGLAESKYTLLTRVEAILNRANTKRWSRPLALALTGVLLASAAAFAAVQLTKIETTDLVIDSQIPKAKIMTKAKQRVDAAAQHASAGPSDSKRTVASADTTPEATFERAERLKDEAAMGLAPWEQVEKAYLAVPEQDPRYSQAREDLGRMYTRWGRYQVALRLLEPVSRGWAALNYAFCLDALGKHTQATALYEQLEGFGTIGVWAEAGLEKPIWPKDLDIRPQPGEVRLTPASGWRATASSSSSPSTPAFAIDGNPYSRWTTEGTQSGQEPGEWFQLIFPASQLVTRIVLDHQGRGTYYVSDWPRGFAAEVTADGASWSEVPGTLGGPNQPATVSFQAARQIRGIRLTLTRAHDPEWWSIFEVYVFGPGKQTQSQHLARRRNPD